MSASNLEYVQSLKEPIYDWFVSRAAKNGPAELVKISDCKEDFKAINIIHLTSVFELLVADLKISLAGGRSRVQQFSLNEEDEDYKLKRAAILAEQARLEAINKATDDAKKITKKRGLAVRDSNVEQQTTVKREKGEVVKTATIAHKKPKLPASSSSKDNDENKQVDNGLNGYEAIDHLSKTPVAATASSNIATLYAADTTATYIATANDLETKQSYHFVPSSELKAKNEMESDALAGLLMDSFVDGELKYYSFRELVLNKFPLIDDQMFSSVILQFEQQNKIFVDGDDIYQI